MLYTYIFSFNIISRYVFNHVVIKFGTIHQVLKTNHLAKRKNKINKNII